VKGIPRLLIGLLAAVMSMSPALADEPEAVLGYWATEDSILEVATAGESLSMRVVALENPVYTEGEEHGPPGAVRVDVNNPDAALRDRPILGLELLSDYAFSKDRWGGKIYDPQSGKLYSSTMWLEDGSLQMRGYIGVSFLGRTQTFAPVADCGPKIVALLRATSFAQASCD
jgi:uncharacterized protein (DUF2147 family)